MNPITDPWPWYIVGQPFWLFYFRAGLGANYGLYRTHLRAH